MPTALPAWPKLADPALPVRLPTCRLPPGWVIAPVADVVSAPVVTVPASDKGPVTASATAVVSVTGPLTVSPCPSVRLKPPALLALPRAVMALPVLVSVVVPADELVSAAVAMLPPVWLIVPELVSDTDVVPVIAPAVWLMTPAMLGPLDEVRLTTGAVTVPERLNGPVVLTAIERPSVTGPVTDKPRASTRLSPAVVAKLPKVVIWLAFGSAADWAEPVSVVAVIRPPVPSVIAPDAVSADAGAADGAVQRKRARHGQADLRACDRARYGQRLAVRQRECTGGREPGQAADRIGPAAQACRAGSAGQSRGGQRAAGLGNCARCR